MILFRYLQKLAKIIEILYLCAAKINICFYKDEQNILFGDRMGQVDTGLEKEISGKVAARIFGKHHRRPLCIPSGGNI